MTAFLLLLSPKLCHPDRSIAIGLTNRNAEWGPAVGSYPPQQAKRLGDELGRLVLGE
jgi:hypothetical protein